MGTWRKTDLTALHFFRIKEILLNKAKKETEELLCRINIKQKYLCQHQI